MVAEAASSRVHCKSVSGSSLPHEEATREVVGSTFKRDSDSPNRIRIGLSRSSFVRRRRFSRTTSELTVELKTASFSRGEWKRDH